MIKWVVVYTSKKDEDIIAYVHSTKQGAVKRFSAFFNRGGKEIDGTSLENCIYMGGAKFKDFWLYLMPVREDEGVQ